MTKRKLWNKYKKLKVSYDKLLLEANYDKYKLHMASMYKSSFIRF